MRVHFAQSGGTHFADGLLPAHGPQSWPWWLLLAADVVKLQVYAPSTGYRLWVYTRWGAWYCDVYFDRRDDDRHPGFKVRAA